MHGDAHDPFTEVSAYTAEPELHGMTKVPGTTPTKRRPDTDTYQNQFCSTRDCDCSANEPSDNNSTLFGDATLGQGFFRIRTWYVLPSTSMVDSVTGLRYAECSRAPDYINIGFLERWGTYACPQCLPSDIVPMRSWTRTLRPPGIRHRHLPYHHTPMKYLQHPATPCACKQHVLHLDLKTQPPRHDFRVGIAVYTTANVLPVAAHRSACDKSSLILQPRPNRPETLQVAPFRT